MLQNEWAQKIPRTNGKIRIKRWKGGEAMNVTKRNEAKTLDKKRNQQSPPSTHMFIMSAVISWCHYELTFSYLVPVTSNPFSRLVFDYLFFLILMKRIPKSSVSMPKQFLLLFFIIVLSASSLIVVYQNRMSGFPHSFLMRAFTHHNLAIGDLNRIKNYSMNQIDHMIKS